MPNANPFPLSFILWLCCAVCLHSSEDSVHNNSRLTCFQLKKLSRRNLYQKLPLCISLIGSKCPFLNQSLGPRREDALINQVWVTYSFWSWRVYDVHLTEATANEWEKELPQRKMRVSCYPRKVAWILSKYPHRPKINFSFFKDTCLWIENMKISPPSWKSKVCKGGPSSPSYFLRWKKEKYQAHNLSRHWVAIGTQEAIPGAKTSLMSR